MYNLFITPCQLQGLTNGKFAFTHLKRVMKTKCGSNQLNAQKLALQTPKSKTGQIVWLSLG